MEVKNSAAGCGERNFFLLFKSLSAKISCTVDSESFSSPCGCLKMIVHEFTQVKRKRYPQLLALVLLPDKVIILQSSVTFALCDPL